MTHDQLLLGLNRNEEAAIQVFFNSHYPGLCLFANNMIKDMNHAREIASDTFLKLWKKENHFKSLNQAKSYIYILTRNACIDYLRKKKSNLVINQNEIELLEDIQGSSMEEKMTISEVCEQVWSEVQKLPNRQREAFMLKYAFDYDTVQIAKILGIEKKTVLNHLEKATAYLQKTLKAKGLPYIFLLVGFSEN